MPEALRRQVLSRIATDSASELRALAGALRFAGFEQAAEVCEGCAAAEEVAKGQPLGVTPSHGPRWDTAPPETIKTWEKELRSLSQQGLSQRSIELQERGFRLAASVFGIRALFFAGAESWHALVDRGQQTRRKGMPGKIEG